MSDKRAIIRRERKKMEKAKKNLSPDGELQRLQVQGMIDGRIIAASVVLEILHDKYGFRQKRAERLLSCISDESAKFEQSATQFTVEWYANRMIERINETPVKTVVRNVKEHIYIVARDEFFVTACAVMFLALNEEFGFSSNAKGTGRTDFVMHWCINRYIEIQLDPDNKTAQYYYDRMKRKTGFNIE